ncbi:MAG TPA: PEP-utilizing enzyme [Dehalococcoidia bacterium]
MPQNAATPADFPIAWADPEDASRLWVWEQMHYPHVVTPLTATLDVPAFEEGINRAARALGIAAETRARVFNGYYYMSQQQRRIPPHQREEEQRRLTREMRGRMPRLTELWEREYLPEVLGHVRLLREFDYATASPGALRDLLERAVENRRRQWELHFLLLFPLGAAVSQFEEHHRSLFGERLDAERMALLQGFENKSVEAGRELWRLSREAAAVAEVAAAIREAPAAEVTARLEAVPAARPFLARLQAYLDEYGWRSDAFELADPTWREDPRVAILNLRHYLSRDGYDPEREFRDRVRQREAMTAELAARIPDGEQRAQYLEALRVAQQRLPLQEDHNFYIDQMATTSLRLPLLALGRRLAEAGALAARDDVFFLTFDEVRQAAERPADLRETVQRRRADHARWGAVTPPPFVGRLPAGFTPDRLRTDPVVGVAPAEPGRVRVLRGVGASAGTATGPARVVRRLAEAEKVQPGDVLVCEMTMPPWTPLFATVAAVVADTGGILSHCAVVAREYGIPCVVGTKIGTRTVQDGQVLTVDGAAGVVRVEPAPGQG